MSLIVASLMAGLIGPTFLLICGSQTARPLPAPVRLDPIRRGGR